MCRLFAILLLVLVTLSGQVRKSDDGFVVDVRGEWINSRTGKPVQPIDSILEGDVIRASRNTYTSDYVILSLHDGSDKRLLCRAHGDCDRFTVPNVKRDTWWSRASASIQAIVPNVVRTGIIGASRAGSGPAEAVLEIGGEVVGLGPALITVGPGDYIAQLVTWAEPEGTGGRTVSGPLNWHPPDASWRPESRVSAGLYKLTVIDRDNQSVGAAVVLLAAGQDYIRFRRAFDRLKNLTESWNLPRDCEESIRTLQAAFLVALSSDPGLSEMDR